MCRYSRSCESRFAPMQKNDGFIIFDKTGILAAGKTGFWGPLAGLSILGRADRQLPKLLKQLNAVELATTAEMREIGARRVCSA